MRELLMPNVPELKDVPDTTSEMTLPVKEDLQVFIRESKYTGNLPSFYPAAIFPQLQPLVDNWKAIREELVQFERQRGVIKGRNNYSEPELSSDMGWSNFYLENFMWRMHRNRKYFPVTCSVLEEIPNCTLGVFSILSPGAAILPHYGDTNGIIRCHLGLDVPAPYPDCGIRVGTEEQGWADGELTLFTEAHLHTTWNHSSKKRYVLVVDFVPRFIRESRMEVCSKVLGAQTYNYVEKRIPFLKKIPDTPLAGIHRLLSLLWRCYLPLQRRLRFL